MCLERFEDFIVQQFMEWAPSRIGVGRRFQFKSPSFEVRKKIHDALVALAKGKSVTFKGISLPYLRLADIKVLPLLHADKQRGFNEHFLAHIRDEPESSISPLKDMALLFIHNSTLDTIVNSAEDLAFEGNIWHPSAIKSALEQLIDKQDEGREVSQCLLDYQFDAVQEDGATMFGFEKLYRALLDGDLQFNELGLFNDPFIKKLSGNTKQIKTRLAENRQLYRSIETEVEHFSGQLQTRLKKFGSKFIENHFPADDYESWKDVDFQYYLDEIKRNDSPTLLYEGIDSSSCTVIARSNGSTKAAQRQLHVIIEVPKSADTFDFSAIFNGNDLDTNQLKPRNQTLSGFEQKATKGPKRSKLNVHGSFDGEPLYFTVGTGARDRSTEKYSFHCLVLGKGEFYVDGFRHNFTIGAKQKIVHLHTDEYSLDVNPGSGKTLVLKKRGEVVSRESVREIDFESLANDSDLIDFYISSGEHQVQFNIEGQVATESLSLPLLFDKDRFVRLLDDDYNGIFSRKRDKILIDNKEVSPIGVRLKLLRHEGEFVDNGLVALHEEEGISLSDLSVVNAELHEAYKELYSYLIERDTLPSLVSWGNEFRECVRKVEAAYLDYLENIQINSVLNENDKLVLNIGVLRNQGIEYLCSYHPLVMSYYLALVDEIVEDTDDASFRYFPPVTLERLSPRGLLPYLYDVKHGFSYVQQLKENPTWLKAVPHEESNYDYVRKVVREKISEFQSAFRTLFSHDGRSKLLINSVNQLQCRELFLGILDYFKDNLDSANHVHVNIYDEHLQFNWFDDFAELSSQKQLKEMLDLNKGKHREVADTIIDLMRTRLTYSKFTHKEAKPKGHAYAHLTFFRNEEKVKTVSVNIDACISGVAADGLICGEASENKGDSYFTAFGLRDTEYGAIPHLRVAKLYGALIRSAHESAAPYTGANAIALAVSEGFKDLLEEAYRASIWTTIIDPKVTLEFFSHQDMTLIHFSDQYTTSAGYDAITVTREKDFYRRVLEQGKGGLIEEFNSFNGDWLLRMLTAPDTERRGIEGEIGAYKFVTSMLANSDIVWVPLSIGEMIRVSGNIGLRIMDSEFSPGAHGLIEGPMSDDILLVGFKDQELFLLPVEVKTGSPQGFDKAVKQVNNLLTHMINMLGHRSMANKIYRALFMRQILIQIDKYRLYGVFDSEYFDTVLDTREEWLRGEYRLSTLDDYPDGMVVAHVDSAAVFGPKYELMESVLCITLPFGLLPILVHTALKELMEEEKIQDVCHVPPEYVLSGESSTTEIIGIEGVQEAEEGGKGMTKPKEERKKEPEPVKHPPPTMGKTPPVPIPTVESVKLMERQSRSEHLTVLLGHRTIDKAKVLWEPTNTNKVFNTNTGIIGTMGTGKTQFTKSLITQLIRNQGSNVDGKPIGVLIFDYKADYVKEDFVQATDARVYDLHKLPFNPFALVGDKPMLPVHTASLFRTTISKAFGLGPKQEQRIHELVMQAYEKCGINSGNKSTWLNVSPTMQAVWDLYLDQEKVEQDSLYAALYDLSTFQIFESDPERTKSLYDSIDGVIVINLSGYDSKIQNLVVAIILDIFYSQMHQHGSSKLAGDYRQMNKMILVDEADNFMTQEFESLKKILKEGREFGVGTVLSTQELTHFRAGDADYSSYILSWIIHRVSQLKNQDIRAIFNAKDKHEEDLLMQEIRQLEKHYSLYVDGEKKVSKIRDKAFWELVEENRGSTVKQ